MFDIVKFAFSSRYIPALSKPSCIDVVHGSCTLLDNIFVENSQSYLSGLIITGISDHYPAYINCKQLLTCVNVGNGSTIR